MPQPPSSALAGDCRDRLRELPDKSAHCCVTSPPYWGLRSYSGGDAAELGREPELDGYVEAIAAVMREVRRVLRDDGTLWLNLGDAYARSGGTHGPTVKARVRFTQWQRQGGSGKPPPGFKTRSLMSIPSRVVHRLLQDGWILRSEIVWHKPCPMPATLEHWHPQGDGVRRTSWRPVSSHEPIYLLAKGHGYYAGPPTPLLRKLIGAPQKGSLQSVWRGPFHASRLRHGAVMQPAMAAACVLIGSPESACAACGAPLIGEDRSCRCEGGTGTRPALVIDPFAGAGTTAGAAAALGRGFVGCELLQENVDLWPARAAEVGEFLSRLRSRTETCAACGEPCADDYMVRREVWALAMPSPEGFLHLRCLAQRLPRALQIEDFPEVEANRMIRAGFEIGCRTRVQQSLF